MLFFQGGHMGCGIAEGLCSQLILAEEALGSGLLYRFSVASVSKLTQTNVCITRARGEAISAVGWSVLNAHVITGAGYWVQNFSSILDSLVGMSMGLRSAGDSVLETLGSYPAFSRGRQLVSFRFYITSLLPGHQHWYQQIWYIPFRHVIYMCVWKLGHHWLR